MATFYFLTDTKEYSTDGINWHTCENARFSRYPDSVIFINDFSSIPIYPATDVVNIDGGVTGNPYTPAALVAALKTVFPKASTTSVSDGSVDLSNYFTRTQSDGRYELVAPASFTDNLTSYKQASTTIYNILDKYTGQYITATEQTTGVDDTMVDNIIYWKISNKYYKRNYSYVIDAKIFGVKADGVTDDTVALQKAIDFCLSNGKAVKLVLPKGAIIISSTLNFGNSSAIDANQASFCVEGQGMNSVSSATGGGTAIKYTGADNTISLFNLRQSFGRYGYFSRFSLMAGSADGANVGINFETSTFSFFRFDEIEIADFKTAVKLNIGGGVNGEFTEWHRCRFTRFSQYGYYHDAPQALSQKFINCNFTPKAGAIVWNYVAVSGGQFIGNDISYQGTGTATPNRVFQLGGPQGDSLGVIGGRWENVQQLAYFNSDTNRIKISLQDVTVSWITATGTNFHAIDFSQITWAGFGQVTADNCTFYRSTEDTALQDWIIKGNTDGDFVFIGNCCDFMLLTPVYTGGTNTNDAVCRLDNCTQSFNDGSNRATRINADLLNTTGQKLGYEAAATYAAISTTRTDLRMVIVAVDETASNTANQVYLFNGSTKIGQLLIY